VVLRLTLDLQTPRVTGMGIPKSVNRLVWFVVLSVLIRRVIPVIAEHVITHAQRAVSAAKEAA